MQNRQEQGEEVRLILKRVGVSDEEIADYLNVPSGLLWTAIVYNILDLDKYGLLKDESMRSNFDAVKKDPDFFSGIFDKLPHNLLEGQFKQVNFEAIANLEPRFRNNFCYLLDLLDDNDHLLLRAEQAQGNFSDIVTHSPKQVFGALLGDPSRLCEMDQKSFTSFMQQCKTQLDSSTPSDDILTDGTLSDQEKITVYLVELQQLAESYVDKDVNSIGEIASCVEKGVSVLNDCKSSQQGGFTHEEEKIQALFENSDTILRRHSSQCTESFKSAPETIQERVGMIIKGIIALYNHILVTAASFLDSNKSDTGLHK